MHAARRISPGMPVTAPWLATLDATRHVWPFRAVRGWVTVVMSCAGSGWGRSIRRSMPVGFSGIWRSAGGDDLASRQTEVRVMNAVLKPDARRPFAAALILACLVSIGSATSASAASASYRCSDGTAVRAVFHGLGQTGSVQLSFAGQGRPVTIPQAPSADGGRYAGGGTEFWIKGTTARLTRQGATTECRTSRR